MPTKPAPLRDLKNRYLKERSVEVGDSTLANYDTTLRIFVDYLEDEHGVTLSTDLDSDLIQRFKEWRLDRVKPITAKYDLITIRAYIKFCEHIDAVPTDLHVTVRVPKLDDSEEVSENILSRDEADAILRYLERFEYATQRHVTVLVLWKTGMRLSGLRALDVKDFDETRPVLEVRHRPDTGTPLKNKAKSERDVNITETTAEILRDYIENTRDDVTDEYGRKPLVTTRYGRATRTTIQRYVYTASRPCYYNGGECPFDRDPEGCEAAYAHDAVKCPGSVSPHAIRRGYVTAARNAGQAKDVTGERVNMSNEVLEKHYDMGTTADKAERRRDYIMDI
jgi:integrase